jgi:hypothetical protein
MWKIKRKDKREKGVRERAALLDERFDALSLLAKPTSGSHTARGLHKLTFGEWRKFMDSDLSHVLTTGMLASR